MTRSGTESRPPTAAVAGLALALALAGCAVQLPEADRPEKPGHAWTDTDAQLWVLRNQSCGFGNGAEEGCATLTLLYRDGSVLRARYGEGGPHQVEGYPRDEGNRSGLTFVFPEQREAYADEVAAAWQAMRGTAPDRVRVHAVDALRLDPTEREDTLRVVEHAIAQADPLAEPTFDCADCAAPVYWTFGAPAAFERQRFGSPPPDDDAWRLLEAQVQSLHAWLDDPPQQD